FFSSSSPKRLIPQNDTIKLLLSLFVTWALVQAFNPALGSPVIGIFGLKNYLIYVPLIWVVPALFNSEEELYKFLRTYLLILIPVGLLATAQFFSPPDSPLNVYAQDDATSTATFGSSNSVRVTGTFSYLAGYGIYATTCLSLLLPILTRNQPLLWRGLAYAELMLIAITIFMTGGRGPVLTAGLLLAGYFSIQGVTQFSSFFRSIRKFLLPGAIATALLIYQYSSALDAFWYRATNASDSLSGRITSSFLEPFTYTQGQQFGGYGTGATYQANEIIRNLFNLPAGEPIHTGYEAEMGRVILELGWVGFLLWYGFRLVLLFLVWRIYQKLKQPFLRQLALGIFLIQAIHLPAQIVFNHTAGIYYWFLHGLAFLLPNLERIANWQFYQQQLQYYYALTSNPSSSSEQ
ncbi:MAG: hypothetical protein BRC42_00460, partial [Cyanobacteria bacterium QS_1_48_34]